MGYKLVRDLQTNGRRLQCVCSACLL